MKKVVIIGGGISGLIASILLTRNGIECLVIEKKNYPLHRVCGEYISNEAFPFLESLDLYPGEFNPPIIKRFLLSSTSGRSKILPLDLGGFGISRFCFDLFLFRKAIESGVEFMLDTTVENVEFLGQSLNIVTSGEQIEAQVVLGAFGKRSNIDSRLKRSFMQSRSPYVGVKYHVTFDHPADIIALHNFPGGYCGVGPVENNTVNVCYLVHRDRLKSSGSIQAMERDVLCVNPFLKEIFAQSKFLFEKPEVINEISFDKKLAVEDHLIMIGDAAGMITPLCGNGMAMAIHSAKIAVEKVTQFLRTPSMSRTEMEQAYTEEWNDNFSRRLFFGRQVQKMFGSETSSGLAVNLALHFKPLAKEIIRNTHGNTF